MKALPSYPNPLLAGRLPAGVPRANLWYRFNRVGYQAATAAFLRVRVFNRHYEPARGSALYVCNHQSYFDPPLMALGLRRPINFMARWSLFRVPLFGQFITSLKAFPVKRGAADMSAIREALRRLRRGEQLVVFPEGTRTYDGRVGAFLPGLAVLARRGTDWVVPTAIEGAYDVWPRSQLLPTPGHVVVAYCRPMGRDEVAGLTNEELIATMRRRIIDMLNYIRRRRGKGPLQPPDE